MNLKRNWLLLKIECNFFHRFLQAFSRKEIAQFCLKKKNDQEVAFSGKISILYVYMLYNKLSGCIFHDVSFKFFKDSQTIYIRNDSKINSFENYFTQNLFFCLCVLKNFQDKNITRFFFRSKHVTSAEKIRIFRCSKRSSGRPKWKSKRNVDATLLVQCGVMRHAGQSSHQLVILGSDTNCHFKFGWIDTLSRCSENLKFQRPSDVLVFIPISICCSFTLGLTWIVWAYAPGKYRFDQNMTDLFIFL